jgi:hypothetical protein
MRFVDADADAEEVSKYRAMLDRVAAEEHAYPEGRFAGRGVVVCGGGDTYFACAWVCIGVLRRVGCALPVELWYRGPAEMNAGMLDIMRSAGVVCVDAYEVARRHPVRRLDSWELKPFAIANSGFEEVLYLDADNVPARDPAPLFDSQGYAETGAVFWPDRYTGGPGSGQEWLKRSAWEVCRVPYRLEPETEAGQLLIDKRRGWHPLALALHMNEHSDFYYAHFYGDKDTFRLAWHRAGRAFARVPHPVRNLGDSDVIVQHDFEGRVLFQHRNGDKWSVTREPKRVQGFFGEDSCRELLAGLRARWRPPVRRLPAEFTRAERAAYEEVCAARWFMYQLEGQGERPLELLPDFCVGRGAALMEVSWAVEEDKDGGAVLSIRNANAPTCFLRRAPGGAWEGRWRVYERMRVRLVPAPGSFTGSSGTGRRRS